MQQLIKDVLLNLACVVMAFAIGVITITLHRRLGNCLINEAVLFVGLGITYGATTSCSCRQNVDWTRAIGLSISFLTGIVATLWSTELVAIDSVFNLVWDWSLVFFFAFVLSMATHHSGADGTGLLTKQDGG